MIRGIYTAAVGMAIQQQRMDVVANNIANAATNGFGRDIVVTQSFQDVLALRVRDPGQSRLSPIIGPMSLGVFTNTVYRDFSNGMISATGSPLDLAITGSGFFEIAFTNGAGEATNMYSRNGGFTISNDGVLTTALGFPVLDTSGNEINIPPGSIAISERGEITVDGNAIAQIRIVDFEDLMTLRPFGHNLYAITAQTVEIGFQGSVLQGHIEFSNVNSVREMVEMISLARTYEANQQMIRMQDQTLSQAVNEIGRR